jgi:hypothetical protein
MTTPCRRSATAYSIYFQLPPYLEAVSSIRSLRTRHAVVTRDPPNMGLTVLSVQEFNSSFCLESIQIWLGKIIFLQLGTKCSHFWNSRSNIVNKDRWNASRIQLRQPVQLVQCDGCQLQGLESDALVSGRVLYLPLLLSSAVVRLCWDKQSDKLDEASLCKRSGAVARRPISYEVSICYLFWSTHKGLPLASPKRVHSPFLWVVFVVTR